jgi:hypothetical protein
VASNDRLVVPLIQTRSRAGRTLAGGTVRVRATKAPPNTLNTTGPYDTVFMNVTSPRATEWNRMLSAYEAFSCTVDTAGATDRAVCEASSLQRVHVVLVPVDTVLER